MSVIETMARISEQIADVAQTLREAVSTLVSGINDNSQSIDALCNRIEKLEIEIDRMKEK